MNFRQQRINYFEHIPSIPNIDMVLTRIGYKKGVTVIGQQSKELLDEGLRLGKLLSNVKGAYGRFKISCTDTLGIKLDNDTVFESESLSKLLGNSSEVVLMSCTAGREIVEKISFEIKNGNAALGIILDSVASQTADGGLSWIMNFLNKLLAREGKKLTRHRYSPGFGDLSLSYQKTIFDILNLEKLGMEVTGSCMLVPEKSVIAITGIEDLS